MPSLKYVEAHSTISEMSETSHIVFGRDRESVNTVAIQYERQATYHEAERTGGQRGNSSRRKSCRGSLLRQRLGKSEDTRKGQEEVNVIWNHCSERYSGMEFLKDSESYSIVQLRSRTVCTEWNLF